MRHIDRDRARAAFIERSLTNVSVNDGTHRQSIVGVPDPPELYVPGHGPLCTPTMTEADMKEEDSLVEAALQSDCNDCRAVLNIGPMGQLGCALKPVLDYVPEPEDITPADSLEAIRARRDGR